MTVFDSSTGTLQVLTGVDGAAARMGHRLTIEVQSWHASLSWEGERPSALTLTTDVNSLHVDSGAGGLTPMTSPERLVARSNALKTLSAKRFPHITFASTDIEATDTGYRITGELQICGRRHRHIVEVAVTGHKVSSRTEVRQSDFGIKPYSMMMGSLRVADTVTINFNASATDSHRSE
ncbi:MAG: YceI family protein [Mycobacterium sp.]